MISPVGKNITVDLDVGRLCCEVHSPTVVRYLPFDSRYPDGGAFR